MNSTAKLVKQVVILTVLALVLSAGSAYMGAKVVAQHYAHSQSNQMKVWSIDYPPAPCPSC